MTVSLLASRTLRSAAKRRLAASSVAPVACGYECSLRPCHPCFSRPQSTICKEGDL